MKTGFIGVLFLIASHKSTPFEIISAYSESWTAGIKEQKRVQPRP